jgi:TnpA family transposase
MKHLLFMNENEISIEEWSGDEMFETLLSLQLGNEHALQIIFQKLHEQTKKSRPHYRNSLTYFFLCQWWKDEGFSKSKNDGLNCLL